MKQITKRGVVDVGRSCHLFCQHCFHKYSDEKNYGYENRKFKPVKEIEEEIEKLVANGRNAVALTGGEPTIHPEFHYILDLCMTSGLRPEIITAGLPNRVKKIINLFGTDKIDWLFSVHGSPVMHDYITGMENSWNNFLLSLFYIKDSFYRLNCVVMSYNWYSLLELFDLYFPIIFEGMEYKTPYTESMHLPKPSQINLIKWRPFYGWMEKEHKEECVRTLFPNGIFYCETSRLEHLICHAFQYTQDVNIRYFKKCDYKGPRSTKYWSTLNYMYDPWEWCNEKTSDEQIALYLKQKMEDKWHDRLYYKNDDICKDCKLKSECEGFLKGYE